MISGAIISGGWDSDPFFCTRSLPGHVAWIVLELSRLLFARLLLIRVFVVAHEILL